MFGWFRKKSSRSTALNRRYEALLREARDLQRKGDIPAFAAKTAEADAVRREIETVEERRRER